MTVDMKGIDIIDIVDRGHAVSVYVKFDGKEFAITINSKTFNMLSEDDILRKVKKVCDSMVDDNSAKINSMKSKLKQN